MLFRSMIGDPGVGKTTVLLDLLAAVQNKGRKCLFISGEMGRKQMFKYTERFKQFGVVQTLFMADYMAYNTKDTIEQVLNMGWDCVLIDSAAEIIDGLRDDNGWDRKTAEAWFVDICIKHNKGENNDIKFFHKRIDNIKFQEPFFPFLEFIKSELAVKSEKEVDVFLNKSKVYFFHKEIGRAHV